MKLASVLALAGVLVTAGCASSGAGDEHAGHTEEAAAATPAAAPAPTAATSASGEGFRDVLPASGTTALQRLNASTRHGEWAVIRMPDGDSIRAWVVYPERSTPAPVVLVVHEIFGLTNWLRSVADQLAAEGFIAIAPDLLTMKNVPTNEQGDPVPEQARAQISTLVPAEYHRHLAAIAEWGMALPAAADSYGIVGFCWGGTAAFQHTISAPGVDAAVVYYGTSPRTEDLARVSAPVLGLYGGDDARVNATVPPADSALRQLGKPFSHLTFEGAGHGFLRQQDGREGANLRATREAWPRTVQFLRQHLGDR